MCNNKIYRIDRRVMIPTGRKSHLNLKNTLDLNKIVTCIVGGNTTSGYTNVTPQLNITGNYVADLSAVTVITIYGSGFTPITVASIVGAGASQVTDTTYINDNTLTITVASDAVSAIYALTVANGTLTSNSVNLEVKDPDVIRANLTGAELVAYNTAANGDWIAVTKAQWDNIYNDLIGASKFGTTDADLKTGSKGNWNNNVIWTFGHNTGPSLPGVYFIGFRVMSERQAQGPPTPNKVRLSTTGANNWLQVGSLLPEGIVDDEGQAFVIKGVTTTTTAPSYLGHTNGFNSDMYFAADNTSGLRNGIDTDNPVTSTGSFGWSMQGMTASSIQWTV